MKDQDYYHIMPTDDIEDETHIYSVNCECGIKIIDLPDYNTKLIVHTRYDGFIVGEDIVKGAIEFIKSEYEDNRPMV